MRTLDFITLLQKEDPNNECEVLVGSHPVRFVEHLPYYYDGRAEFIERNEKNTVIKAGYKAGGYKLKIHYDTLEDVLIDNPDVELELSGITYEGKLNPRYMEFIEKWRQDGVKHQNWRKKFHEACERGEGDKFPLIIDEDITWRHKLGTWLEKIGLIKIER